MPTASLVPSSPAPIEETIPLPAPTTKADNDVPDVTEAAAAAAAAATSSSTNDASSAMTIQDAQDMTADEYMRLVNRQAKSLPDVFVSVPTNPPKTTIATTTSVTSAKRDAVEEGRTKKRRRTSEPPIDGCAASVWHMMLGGGGGAAGTPCSVDAHLLGAPTIRHLPANPRQWVDRVLHQFSVLRQYMERLHSFTAEVASTGRGLAAPSRNRMPVPAMKDRVGWIRFCVGADYVRGSHDASDRDKEGGGSQNGGKKTAWMDQLPPGGYAPEVPLLMQLDQVMTRAVLSHLTAFVTDQVAKVTAGVGSIGVDVVVDVVTPSLGAWLYGTLARLEKPLHRNDASTLYQLLKQLTRARHLWSPTDPIGGGDAGGTSRQELSRLNLVIAIVGIYFEQGGYQAVMTCAELGRGVTPGCAHRLR